MMSLVSFSPAFALMLGGLAMVILHRFPTPCRALVVATPVLSLLHIWGLDGSMLGTARFLGYELLTVAVQPYTLIFSTVFAIAALGGGIFWWSSQRWREIGCAYLYAGSAIGVTFAGDLITFFIYWEMMAIASLFLIWGGHSPEARSAGIRYALLHFLGGMLLLSGIILHISVTHVTVLPTFDFDPENLMWGSTVFFDSEAFADYEVNLRLESLAIWLIFLGMIVNVGAPPFSSWISDAYPESSAGGMVFLSAFTTKTAVYALLTMFAGAEILIPIGLFMVFYGIVYAILENDMRRILAFSIVNQVGFMVTGIGIGTTLAQQGVAAHAFCHIIYKALLLMSAGAVLHQTGVRKCSDLGGLFRSMPITCACGIVGALAISAFPLTSGFVSKSLISAAAADKEMVTVWLALAAASAGVFLHAGIKFPWFVFFQKDSGLRPKEAPLSMRVAMLAFAALCILPGLFPSTFYEILPYHVTYSAMTIEHVVSQLQLLLFSGLAFFVCLPLLRRTPTISLTFDWLYRRPITGLLIALEKLLNQVYNSGLYAVQQRLRQLVSGAERLTGPQGILAETKPLANTALLVAVLLGGYLLLYLNT